MINAKIILETEKLLEEEQFKYLHLLLNITDGSSVVALFRNYNDAVAYMNRDAINTCVQICTDDLEYNSSFYDYVKDYITSEYQIINVIHLDPSKPIYKVQCGNYRVRGRPDDYLTNSLDIWTIENKNKYKRTVDKKWQDYCTVKVDPVLPPLVNYLEKVD